MSNGLKVVGKINLSDINEATRPAKKSKEELEMMRQMDAEEAASHNRAILIRDLTAKRDQLQQDIREATEKANTLRHSINEIQSAHKNERDQQEKRLKYLKEKQAVRERYAASSISNMQRQKELTFQGIRPQKMDVVHFHVPKVGNGEEMDGVALVRDENHYYIAVDMYDHPEQEDNATTMMDENPDGTFEGIWPKYTVLKPAQKFEERFMRNLTDKYADDLSAAEEFVATIQKKEAEEITQLTQSLATISNETKEKEQCLADEEEKIRQMNGELLSINDELRRYRQEGVTDGASEDTVGENAEVLDFSFDDAEYEPMEGLDLDTPTEQLYRHLPYIRGRRQMLTMNWPQIEYTYEGWLRFRLMGNIARLIYMLRKAHALTYVLTEEYYEEMAKRGRDYYKSMKVDDVVPHGESAAGIIVYPSQGYQDSVLYRIDNRNQLGILVVYLREDKLMFYESYSMQEVLNRPRTDHFMCKSLKESGTEPGRLFSWIRNLIISHLAMENDMERVVRHLIDEDKGSATETDIGEDDDVDTTNDRDVVLRDAAWYTDITVNREIPVRGYISHRWCGTGKNKYIREVWVRPHVKHGYHRQAGVKTEK